MPRRGRIHRWLLWVDSGDRNISDLGAEGRSLTAASAPAWAARYSRPGRSQLRSREGRRQQPGRCRLRTQGHGNCHRRRKRMDLPRPCPPAALMHRIQPRICRKITKALLLRFISSARHAPLINCIADSISASDNDEIVSGSLTPGSGQSSRSALASLSRHTGQHARWDSTSRSCGPDTN
jgi:hypothetical protein